MARIKLEVEEKNETTSEFLDVVIPRFAANKSALEQYKTICEEDNTAIKKEMARLKIKSYSADGFTAKTVEAHKEVIDPALLLEVVKRYDLPVVKTVEVVDTEKLENYLYHHVDDLPEGLAADLNKCKSETVTVSLRISNNKNKL